MLCDACGAAFNVDPIGRLPVGDRVRAVRAMIDETARQALRSGVSAHEVALSLAGSLALVESLRRHPDKAREFREGDCRADRPAGGGGMTTKDH